MEPQGGGRGLSRGAAGGEGERPLGPRPPKRDLYRRVRPPGCFPSQFLRAVGSRPLPKARTPVVAVGEDSCIAPPRAAAGVPGRGWGPPPPGARGAGMELFQAKDHYILQQGERALWCSRRDGGLQLRPGEARCAGWVGRAGQLERGGARPGSPSPEQRSGGWAGRWEMSALVLRAASCAAGRAGLPLECSSSSIWGLGSGDRVPHKAPRRPPPAAVSSCLAWEVLGSNSK